MITAKDLVVETLSCSYMEQAYDGGWMGWEQVSHSVTLGELKELPEGTYVLPNGQHIGTNATIPKGIVDEWVQGFEGLSDHPGTNGDTTD